MPALIPVVVGAAIKIAVGGGLLGSVLGGLASIATQFIFSGLGSKKKSSSAAPLPQDIQRMVRASAEARRRIYGLARVSGPLVYSHSTGANDKYLHMVIPLAHRRITAVPEVYFDDIPASDPRFAGHYRINVHLGEDDQEADADLVAEVLEWTTAHRLRGIAYIYVRLLWNESVWPTGIPNITADVTGHPVWDPRDEDQDTDDPDTWAWSDNWALVVLDYLRLARADGGVGTRLDDLGTDTFIAAANSNEDVQLADGSTQKRYRCNGVVSLDQLLPQVIEDLLTGGSGDLVYAQGKYRLFAGEYRTPLPDVIDETMLRGPLSVRPRVSAQEAFNRVRGTYVNADDNWQLTDYPAVENATYVVQDNGEEVTLDLPLPYEIDPTRAQRLAKIALERSRQGITVEFPGKPPLFKVACMDNVKLSIAHLGWNDKVFQVRGWSFSDDGGIDLVLREEAAEVYDWAAGAATAIDPAPDTDLPSAFGVGLPGAPEVAESLYLTRDGAGLKTKVDLTWTAAEDGFVVRYEPEYRLKGATAWIGTAPVVDPAARIFDLAPGVYQFRVRARNALGIASEFAQSEREIFGLAGAPAALTGLTLAVVGGMVLLQWDPSPDLDVLEGGVILVRHSPDIVDPDWLAAVSIGPTGGVPGRAVSAVLPLKPGSYLVRPRDSSGVLSAGVVWVSTKQAELLAYAALSTVSEHPAFTGWHTDTVAVDSVLTLAGADAIDDWGDVDDVSNWDAEGGIVTAGTYDFAAGLDLGSVKRVRLTSETETVVANVLDKIDDRTANIDDWADFDGTTGAEADLTVWVRQTDDDPAASPTWSDWHRLDSGVFEARGFDFQARLSAIDPAYNIRCETLAVHCDEVA